MSPQVGTLTRCPEIQSANNHQISSSSRESAANVAQNGWIWLSCHKPIFRNISNSRPALLQHKDPIFRSCLRRRQVQCPQGGKQCQRARNYRSDHLKKNGAHVPLPYSTRSAKGKKRCSKVIDERITSEAGVAQQVVGVTSRVRLSTAYSCASVNITSLSVSRP